MSKPKKVDNFTQGCTCENCGKALHATVIWIWEEHFGCSKSCVEICYYDARPDLVTKAEEVTDDELKSYTVALP